MLPRVPPLHSLPISQGQKMHGFLVLAALLAAAAVDYRGSWAIFVSSCFLLRAGDKATTRWARGRPVRCWCQFVCR
jgi:hypothetical protein